MGQIHDYLSALVKTKPHQAWALTAPIDARKVTRALAGERPPTPGSAYAQQLVGLAYLDPPNVTAPPPPTAAIDPLWARDGVFVRSLSSFHGDLRDAARSVGFSVIYVQLDHSGDVAGNRAELQAIGAGLRARGWSLVGWSTYGQGVDPAIDGARHAAIRRELDVNLDGWIANGEIWAEGMDAWKTTAFLEGWRNAGGFGPIAVSCMSSDNPNFARSFDYQRWLAIPGAAVMPQVYGASHPAYTVQNALATMGNGGVPSNRLNMTFDVIQGVGPFANYKTWTGPRSVWTGEDSTVTTWGALKR